MRKGLKEMTLKKFKGTEVSRNSRRLVTESSRFLTMPGIWLNIEPDQFAQTSFYDHYNKLGGHSDHFAEDLERVTNVMSPSSLLLTTN